MTGAKYCTIASAKIRGAILVSENLRSVSAACRNNCSIAPMSGGRAQAPGLALVRHRAFVPVAQQEIGEAVEQEVDRDAGQRQHEQGREQARDLQPVARFQDAEREAGLDAAASGP